MDESYLYSSDTGLAKLPVPESPGEGITFAGWYKNGDLSDTPVTEIAPGTKGQLMLVAVWMLDTSYLDINGNAGSTGALRPFILPESSEIEGMAFTFDPDIFMRRPSAPYSSPVRSLPSSEKYSHRFSRRKTPSIPWERRTGNYLYPQSPADCVKVILRRVSPNAPIATWRKGQPAAEASCLRPETLYTYWDSVSLGQGRWLRGNEKRFSGR